MHCSNCGTQVSSNDKHCPSCGYKIVDDQVTLSPFKSLITKVALLVLFACLTFLLAALLPPLAIPPAILGIYCLIVAASYTGKCPHCRSKVSYSFVPFMKHQFSCGNCKKTIFFNNFGKQKKFTARKPVSLKIKEGNSSEFSKALSWGLGLLAGFIGLLGLSSSDESFLISLCLISISLILLPPARIVLFAITKKRAPTAARIASVLILITFIGYIHNLKTQRLVEEAVIAKAEQEAKIAAEKAEQERLLSLERQTTINYFLTNRVEIISTTESALVDKRYQEVIDSIDKYLITNDKELIALNDKAKAGLEKQRKEERAKSILSQLKDVPVSDYAKNKALYTQLVVMYPNNENYQKKFDYYTIKLAKQEQAEKASSQNVSSTSEYMSFEKCLLTIQLTSNRLGVTPTTVLDAEIVRTVRLPTTDGSVLITCSKPDQKMVVTRSPYN